MKLILAIATGGAIGAVSRHLIAGHVMRLTGAGFPWGTLTVNIIGSFVMGLLIPVFANKVASEELRALLTVGFLGSLTTFSTFSMETVNLFQRGDTMQAGLNIIVSVGACIIGVLAGIQAGRLFV